MALQKSRLTRYQFSLKTLMLLVVLVAIALVTWKPLAIVYHRHRLHQAWQSSDTVSDLAHTRALVQLGFYEERQFVFKHVVVGSPESRALISDLRDFGGDLPLKDGLTSMMSGSSPGDIDAITIWVIPEHMSQAVSIVEAYDTPSQ